MIKYEIPLSDAHLFVFSLCLFQQLLYEINSLILGYVVFSVCRSQVPVMLDLFARQFDLLQPQRSRAAFQEMSQLRQLRKILLISGNIVEERAFRKQFQSGISARDLQRRFHFVERLYRLLKVIDHD